MVLAFPLGRVAPDATLCETMPEINPSKIKTLVFLEGAGGTLERFSQARFSRLYSQDKTESLPEYAGKWLRAAQITVGMKAKRPPVIIQAHYVKYRVQKNGRFNPACLWDHLRLGSAQFEKSLGPMFDPEVLHAAPHLEWKKLAARLLWEPTAAQDRAVREAALGAVAQAWEKTLNPSKAATLRKRFKTLRDRRAQAVPTLQFPLRTRDQKAGDGHRAWRVFLVSGPGGPRKISKESFFSLGHPGIGGILPTIAGSPVDFAVVEFALGAGQPARIFRKHFLRITMGPLGKPNPRDQEALSRFIIDLDFPFNQRPRVGAALRWKPTKRQEREILPWIMRERVGP